MSNDSDKLKAENEQISAELAILAQKLNAQVQLDDQDAISNERFMDRLRKEGKGL